MRRPALIGLVVAGVLAAAPAFAAAPPPAPAPTPPPSRPDRRLRTVTDVLNRAIQRTYALHPECRPADPFRRRPTFTDDAPRQATLDTYALLRRPQQPGDIAPDASISFAVEGIYRQYERVGRTASGRRVRVVVARRTQFYEPLSDPCVQALRRRFARVMEQLHRGARFERRARRSLDGYVRAVTTPGPPADQDGLFVLSGGGGAGGTPLSYAQTHGVFLGSFRSGLHHGRLTGLVPDGVASIRFHIRGHGTRTAAVRDNVISVGYPLVSERALFPRMDWLAADGTVIRVVSG